MTTRRRWQPFRLATIAKLVGREEEDVSRRYLLPNGSRGDGGRTAAKGDMPIKDDDSREVLPERRKERAQPMTNDRRAERRHTTPRADYGAARGEG
jgi:hypothetical protein